MLKYALGIPVLIAVPTAIIGYKRRQDNLNDPVLNRALMHIRNDQRIIDFCGEEVKPGWIITKKTSGAENNWVKYDFTVKGMSGKLKTTVIGDYLNHAELLILEREREEYSRQKEVLKETAAAAPSVES
jgi:Cytochrome oxidase complex assembly protein 1